MHPYLKRAYFNVIQKYSTQPFRAQKAPELIRSDVQHTSLPNGIIVASFENLSPVSRIGVFIKAGSRFEQSSELGLTHLLRYAAGMTTQTSTIFGITRNIDQIGGSLSASNSRDFMLYRLDGLRPLIGSTFKYFADTITRPAFKFWQLEDYSYRLKVDVKRFNQDPQSLLLDELHRISFRGGLANSLYYKEHMLGKHSEEALMQFWNKYFLSNRMVVIGIGTDFNALVDEVRSSIVVKSGQGPELVNSKFIGGESRIHSDNDITFVAIATEGVSGMKLNNVLASLIFQHMLEIGSRVKYSAGLSPLSQAATNVAKEPYSIQILNYNYCDTGLFGVIIAAHYKDIQAVTKAVVHKMREIAKNMNEQELVKAKNKLKASLYLSGEDSESLMYMWGTQALNNKEVYSLEKIEKACDSITLNEVSNIASKIMKGKGSLVSIGNTDNTLYLEDLI